MNAEKAIQMIDEYLAEPNTIAKEWVECLLLCKEALEKQIPKHFELWNGQCSCPNCNKLFGSYSQFKTLIHWEMPHCKYCGQTLDWDETEKDGAE